MKRNQTREDFRNSILLALGYPLINVNLTDDHLDLCINNALKYFWKYHPNGSVETYYVYQLQQADVTNGYITVPVWIDAVVECLRTGFTMTDMNFATAEYQISKALFMSATRFMNISLTDYVCLKEMLYNTQQVIDGPLTFNHDRYRRRVTPLFPMNVGDTVVFRCYENVDPEKDDNPNMADAPNVWDDEVLKDFAIAEAKILWGDILSKFGGVQLPGDVTIDGERLVKDGEALKQKTLSFLKEFPVDFFMG